MLESLGMRARIADVESSVVLAWPAVNDETVERGRETAEDDGSGVRVDEYKDAPLTAVEDEDADAECNCGTRRALLAGRLPGRRAIRKCVSSARI